MTTRSHAMPRHGADRSRPIAVRTYSAMRYSDRLDPKGERTKLFRDGALVADHYDPEATLDVTIGDRLFIAGPIVPEPDGCTLTAASANDCCTATVVATDPLRVQLDGNVSEGRVDVMRLGRRRR